MLRNNSVIFKGRRDGITILLDGETDYDEIRRVLTEKLVDAAKFFGDSSTSISFKGRNLTEEQETELLTIIATKTRLEIKFFGGSDPEPNPRPSLSAPLPLTEKFSALDPVGPVSSQPDMTAIGKPADTPAALEMMTHYCQSSLRSGQSIRFDGSVVVIGDVNPGAEIIASGNIIVFGTLKGLVHAGCKGNQAAFVSALCLQPVQLRIADIYTYIPLETIRTKKKIQPAHAYIENGKIFIQPFTE